MWCRKNSNATSVFESIQKLKQNKTNLQKKTQPLIHGNKRHRMVAGAWGLECYWWRKGGLPAWGGTNRIYLIGQIESEEKNQNKGNSQDKKLPLIRGNNRHRMVPGAWRFDMSWWRNGWFTESGIPWWFIWLWAGEMRDSCSAHLWEEQSTTSHASEYGTEGQTMFWIPNRGYGWLL